MQRLTSPKWILRLVVIAALGIWLVWWGLRPAPPVAVGLLTSIASGAVVGSSEIQACDMFLEESKSVHFAGITVVDDDWKMERAVPAIEGALDQGIRFFVSSHPSKVALAGAHLFSDGRALVINIASAAPALTGKDDYLLRIIPDAVQEQRAMAQEVAHWSGKRLLVLQDEGNLPYTDPAFATFATTLAGLSNWQIDRRKLVISEFKPAQLQSVLAGDYDALYILAGTFQPAIGNVSQLFNRYHPDAPILLTPWARSPAIMETAGDAVPHIVLASIYPPRHADAAIGDYYQRFSARFGYQPHSMTIGVRQALELLDQAFAAGYRSPEAVKHYLLSTPAHDTSLGTISFDRNGDVTSKFYFIRDVAQELR